MSTDGGHFGHWTVPEPALTLAEVQALAEGTEVECVWSGGNGPHRYRVVFDGRHDPYLVSLRDYETGPEGPMWFYNSLSFVGPHPRNEVRVVTPSATSAQTTSVSDGALGAAHSDSQPKGEQ